MCPAGEDVIGPFLADRKGFLEGVVDPLQDKAEPIYVVPGSDAEEHVAQAVPAQDDPPRATDPRRTRSGRSSSG